MPLYVLVLRVRWCVLKLHAPGYDPLNLVGGAENPTRCALFRDLKMINPFKRLLGWVLWQLPLVISVGSGCYAAVMTTL